MNYDYHVGLSEKEIRQTEDRDILLSDWKSDIDALKAEIRIQEMVAEFFKLEMLRLLDLCVRNKIDPKH